MQNQPIVKATQYYTCIFHNISSRFTSTTLSLSLSLHCLRSSYLHFIHPILWQWKRKKSMVLHPTIVQCLKPQPDEISSTGYILFPSSLSTYSLCIEMRDQTSVSRWNIYPALGDENSTSYSWLRLNIVLVFDDISNQAPEGRFYQIWDIPNSRLKQYAAERLVPDERSNQCLPMNSFQKQCNY